MQAERSVALRVAIWLVAGLVALVAVVLATLAIFSIMAAMRQSVPPGHAGRPGQYVSADGLDIHYMSWGPETGRPILLIHGTLAWSGTWYEIADRLAARGYYVIAPDVPPFGFSSRPAEGLYARASQARRILAFADALGLDRFVLAGHSFGGGATVEAAFIAPQRIEGLVLLDAALGLDAPGGTPRLAGLFATPLAGPVLTSATFANPLMLPKGLRDFIADDRIVDDARVALYAEPLSVAGTSQAISDWLATALFADESASLAARPERYRAFEPPALVIWGRLDTVTPLAQGQRIAGLLPRSRLVVLDGVNHIPHVEAPDAVAGLIAEFAATLGEGADHLPGAVLRRTR